jgi:hypothetical protein
MAAQKKQLSLDTNFDFDLAADKDFAHEFREIFQSKGYALVLPPTAANELHFIFTHGGNAVERGLARTALNHLLQWGIRPFDLNSQKYFLYAPRSKNIKMDGFTYFILLQLIRAVVTTFLQDSCIVTGQ